MTEPARGTRQGQAPEPQRLGILDMVDLTAYRIHLEMILERLEGLASRAVDRGAIQQHKRLNDAQRFLRGASTCLGLVVDLSVERPAETPERNENDGRRVRRQHRGPPAAHAARNPTGPPGAAGN